MIALGIESTAHTIGIGIVDEECRILANRRDMYKPELGKGFTPNELGEHHMQVIETLLRSALKDAGLKIGDVGIVSFSQGMGIPNALKIGANLARYISLKFSKHLVGVNHGIAHIEIGKIKTGSKDPVIVYLSGGNSQILAYVDGHYRVFGETQDIPVGNSLDVLSRSIGLPMPGGPEIEKLAKFGKFIDLPYVVKGMDMSFTGIMTEAMRRLKNGISKEDIAYSMQETCFSMLTEVVERALAHTGKHEVLLVGGVAANKRLQEMMGVMCDERGARLFVVPQEYSGDNGVMIAWAGMLSGQKLDITESSIRKDWRTEQVKVTWI